MNLEEWSRLSPSAISARISIVKDRRGASSRELMRLNFAYAIAYERVKSGGPQTISANDLSLPAPNGSGPPLNKALEAKNARRAHNLSLSGINK